MSQNVPEGRQERRRFLTEKSQVSLSLSSDPEQISSVAQLRGSPVIAKVSQINGIVNRFSMDDLQRNLRDFQIEDQGSQESCRKRLKNHLRIAAIAKVNGKPLHQHYNYDVICVVDFEATCDRETAPSSPQEIIEFPAFLVDVRKRHIISTFHHYVKPSQSCISPFCTDLTGITAEVIGFAPPFSTVIDLFEDWLYSSLKKHSYASFAFASDGCWDFAHFFAVTCHISAIPFPAYAKRWINIRKVFSSHYKTPSITLTNMLQHLGMAFEGRKHCGYDDTKNIARLLIRMLLDGANPIINERISWHSAERSSWPGVRAGVLRVFYDKPSDGLNLSDSEDEVFEAVYQDPIHVAF